MSTPVELRCPRCGARLTAYPPDPLATSYTRCPHCGSVLPFVTPREPAPLYSWEVYPGLYPPTPVPRPPSRWREPALLALLLAATVLLAALGGIFAWVGSDALRPGTLTVGGTVVPAVSGAWVEVHGENGFHDNVSAASGAFTIAGIPYGGLDLSAGAPGYSTLEVEMFYSPVYSSLSGSWRAIQLDLSRANGTSLTVVDTTSFPDLESFVATVWSGSGLLWTGALLSGLGVLAARRGKLPWVVVGGSAAVVAPFVLPLLGIDVISAATTASALAAFPVGLVVLILVVPELTRAQPPVEPL